MHPGPETPLRPPHFAHRPNPDGTIDSICSHCFFTVATKQWESDLEAEERKHICDPEELERITYMLGQAAFRYRAQRPEPGS